MTDTDPRPEPDVLPEEEPMGPDREPVVPDDEET